MPLAASEAAARQFMARPWHETGWPAQLAPQALPALQLPPHGCFCNLPQRVDRFDDDIAHIVTNSAKRSGLTFAPEAGTQVGLSSAALGCRLPRSAACTVLALGALLSACSKPSS